MNGSKRTISALLVICLLAALVAAGMTQPEGAVTKKSSIFADRYKDSLILWYSDDSLTDYLNAEAVDYLEKYSIKITPVLVSGVDYFEQINQASISTNEGPDLYLTNNGNLEKAVLSGLAEPVMDPSHQLTTKYYPQAALNAVTYQGTPVAYPFYYETAFFLYNRSYLEEYARNRLEAETAQAVADASEEGAEPVATGTASQEAVTASANALIPDTIEDILTFANEYDAPENVEAVFKWDVSDIFYNYFIVGSTISVGGDTGDKEDDMDIYNENSLACMNLYQQLNQFFSIDSKVVNYADILQEFIEGKTVFTIATTDAFQKISEARAAGEFPYEYGVAALPDISDSIASRGLSVTGCIAVNGFSQKQEAANRFAEYLMQEGSSNLYQRSGKVASRIDVTYEDEQIQNAMLEYEKSFPIPKLMSTENFWVQLEIAFTKIWNGKDTKTVLSELAKSYEKE